MPLVNRGKLSRFSRCPRCGHYYKDIEGHVLKIYKTTLSELRQRLQQSAIIQRAEENPNLLNPRCDNEHVSMLVREKDNRQEISNLNQVTPNLHSTDEQISILIRGEDNKQDNPDLYRQEIPNSHQGTPTPNSYND
ncbi:34473_t:CDS:1 [Gigaspora margarita]|uniref:34473_t:CDS:1 n=1 Tax=Gigaspora margarita TaxID=4874 RepID=A0ABN7WRX5_GIGMA|nr:34473_t:CDS:1 [Gigaspora margarita]